MTKSLARSVHFSSLNIYIYKWLWSINFRAWGKTESVLRQQLEKEFPVLKDSSILEEVGYKVSCTHYKVRSDHQYDREEPTLRYSIWTASLSPSTWALGLTLLQGASWTMPSAPEITSLRSSRSQRCAFWDEAHQATLGYLQIKGFFKATASDKLSLVPEATCLSKWPTLSLWQSWQPSVRQDQISPCPCCCQDCTVFTLLVSSPASASLPPSPRNAQDKNAASSDPLSDFLSSNGSEALC